MAKQDFAAGPLYSGAGGQNLDALQANDYNWTVSTKTASYALLAADVGTRIAMNVATANTVTVNTSLFAAGDVVKLQNIGAGITTVTAGTATVSGAGGFTLTQYQEGWLYFVSAGVSIFYKSAGGSGMTLISAATFSGATTASLPADSFTATYQNYLLRVVLSSVNVAGDILSLRLRAAGADDSANSYYGSSTGAQGGTTAYLSNNPATSLQLAYLSATAGRVAGDIIIRAPKEAVRTRFTHSIIGVQAGDTVACGWVGGGFFDVATVFDALTLIGTSNIAGNYQLFGFANA